MSPSAHHTPISASVTRNSNSGYRPSPQGQHEEGYHPLDKMLEYKCVSPHSPPFFRGAECPPIKMTHFEITLVNDQARSQSTKISVKVNAWKRKGIHWNQREKGVPERGLTLPLSPILSNKTISTGHAEIEGNERADTEAKKAATDPTLSQPHNYKPLISTRARHVKAAAKERWHTAWNENTKTQQHYGASQKESMRRQVQYYIMRSQKETRGENRTTKNRALWIEALPPSLWHQEHIILQVWIRKGASGTLPGVQKS